jgi:hypothetical protein
MYMKFNDLEKQYESALNEGFFDRLKARVGQATGAVQGAGQQVKGMAQHSIP